MNFMRISAVVHAVMLAWFITANFSPCATVSVDLISVTYRLSVQTLCKCIDAGLPCAGKGIISWHQLRLLVKLGCYALAANTVDTISPTTSQRHSRRIPATMGPFEGPPSAAAPAAPSQYSDSLRQATNPYSNSAQSRPEHRPRPSQERANRSFNPNSAADQPDLFHEPWHQPKRHEQDSFASGSPYERSPAAQDMDNFERPGRVEDRIMPRETQQANEQKDSASVRDRSRTGASRKPSSSRICGKCGESLTGQFVRALGDTFHLDCFTCAVSEASPAYCYLNMSADQLCLYRIVAKL
jgi:hypothetical protein